MYDETTAGDKPYIWLRYTTQFTTNGRTHTIEMGIPVPVGASAETREQLIREAEAGMEQLSRHVDQRVNQMLQRTARPQSTTLPASIPYAMSPTAQPTNKPTTAPSPPPPTPAPATTQANIHEATPPPEKKEPVTSARPGIGANMLGSPNQSGDVTGNMKLSHFIMFIRENWSMTPKEAMDLLQLKTLNGLNYREALKQLQAVLAEQSTQNTQDTARTTERAPAETNVLKATEKSAQSTPVGRTASGANVAPPTSAPPPPIPLRPAAQGNASLPSAVTRSSAPSSPAQADGSKIPIIPIRNDMVHDTPDHYGFDEEEDEEDLELDLDEEDLGLRLIAQEKLDKLRAAGGTMAVSPSRLTVLQNVIGDQVSEMQLQQLIRAVWKAASTKKLKVDQTEVLISWAKEDDFENEVKAVLALLEEEDSYAGSDR